MFSKIPACLLATLCTASLLLSSCESQKPAAATAPAAATPAATPVATPVAEARYECPMGCAGSQSSKPGKCPVCEMALVKKS